MPIVAYFLNSDSFMHEHCLFLVIHVWHQHFYLYVIKNYLTELIGVRFDFIQVFFILSLQIQCVSRQTSATAHCHGTAH